MKGIEVSARFWSHRLARLGIAFVTAVVVTGSVSANLGGSGTTAATYYTRTSSCHGLNFAPLAEGKQPESVGTRRTSGQPGYYLCDAGLPNKAIVTRVRFTLYDATPFGEVTNCQLVRGGLSVTTAETYDVMAQVGPTVTNQTTPVQRFTDTTITNATVDNALYAYWLQCYIQAAGAHYEGIFGADVTYKITAANG